MASIFAPILNTTAGLTLTPEQWQRTGLEYFGLEVLQLLQRPEYAKHVKVPGKLILDMRSLKVSGSGKIAYRGTDGAKCYLTDEQLFEWIQTLKPDYIAFENDLPVIFKRAPEHLVISDVLSDKAYHGHFIADNCLYSIVDSCYAHDFQLLDKDCLCESCQQGFSRAYLHHLFQHTPMLAQRYLMMHNMFTASRLSASILTSMNAL